MKPQTVKEDLERFRKKLQDAASKQAIPIEKLDMRELPNKDAFEVAAKSGRKERVFTIEDSALDDPQEKSTKSLTC